MSSKGCMDVFKCCISDQNQKHNIGSEIVAIRLAENLPDTPRAGHRPRGISEPGRNKHLSIRQNHNYSYAYYSPEDPPVWETKPDALMLTTDCEPFKPALKHGRPFTKRDLLELKVMGQNQTDEDELLRRRFDVESRYHSWENIAGTSLDSIAWYKRSLDSDWIPSTTSKPPVPAPRESVPIYQPVPLPRKNIPPKAVKSEPHRCVPILKNKSQSMSVPQTAPNSLNVTPSSKSAKPPVKSRRSVSFAGLDGQSPVNKKPLHNIVICGGPNYSTCIPGSHGVVLLDNNLLRRPNRPSFVLKSSTEHRRLQDARQPDKRNPFPRSAEISF